MSENKVDRYFHKLVECTKACFSILNQQKQIQCFKKIGPS